MSYCKQSLILLSMLITYQVCDGQPTKPVPILRTMTFNTWQAGAKVENGLTKIVQQIRGLHADIVFLQEMNAKAFDELMAKLGPKWSGLIHNEHKESKPAVVTKHKIIGGTKWHTDWTFGMTIFHDRGVSINVVNAHLNYRAYGPYIVANSKKPAAIEEILSGDYMPNGRLRNVIQMKDHPGFQKFLADSSAGTPLILAGDFNEPSHLDWDDKTKNVHNGIIVEWPVTKLLCEKLEFVDSFRQINSKYLDNPGTTWSSVWADPEPQDRIDFIFYHPDSGTLRPVRSFTFSGTDPPNKLPEREHWVEDGELEAREWPSDHLAVVTDFQIKILDKN